MATYKVSFGQAVDELKSRVIPEYMLTPAENGKGFICVGCNNGTGGGTNDNARLSKDGTRLLCGKCGKGFSYIDVACHYYRIDLTNFAQGVKELCKRENIQLDDNAADSVKPARKQKNTAALERRIKQDISDAHKRWQDFSANISPVDKRGINDDTAETFQLGIDYNWTSPDSRLDDTTNNTNSNYPTARILIPHLPPKHLKLKNFNLSYCAALLTTERNKLDAKGKEYKKYLYGGTRTLFGLNTITADTEILGACEGEYDAMSINQATGIPCLATGGAKLDGVAATLQQIFTNKKPYIIFFGDNDGDGTDKGGKIATDFVAELNRAGFPVVADYFAPFGTEKLDANKILVELGDAELKRRVNEIIERNLEKLQTIAADLKNLAAPLNLTLPPNVDIVAGKLTYGDSHRIISYTAPYVTKKFRQGDTILFEVSFLVDKKWKRRIVQASNLYDKNKLVALADFGLDVNTSNNKAMCDYFVNLIGINAAIIPVDTIYEQGGWLDNSCADFIYPVDKNVFSADFDYQKTFETRGDETAFKELLQEVLTDSYIAPLVLGVALAAPLIHVLKISNKQLHLGCRSNSGKTALAKLVLAIFGNPKFLMTKFNGTANALEKFAVALNDFPSGIDELQSINKWQRNEIDDLIYNFESGRIRGRLTKQGNFQPFKYFRGCRITTGEQTLTAEFSNEGAKKRVIEITDNHILSEGLAIKIHRLVAQNYGFFGRLWVEYIATHQQDFINDYDVKYDDYCKRFPLVFAEHISCLAAAQVAVNHFCRLIFDTPQNLAAERIIQQLPTRQAMQNGVRAIAAVADFVSSREKYFPTLQGGTIPLPPKDLPPFIHGYTAENGDALIFKQALRDCLKDFPNFQAIIRDFEELGYLDVGNDKYHKGEKAVWVDGKTRWVFRFKKAALFGNSRQTDTVNSSDDENFFADTETIEEEGATITADDGYSFEEDD